MLQLEVLRLEVLHIKKLKNQLPPKQTFTYHLNKLVCNIWYESGNKPGEHKHLDAHIPINAEFSKSKIAIKKRKTNHCMKYLQPKQTCMQKLVTIGR